MLYIIFHSSKMQFYPKTDRGAAVLNKNQKIQNNNNNNVSDALLTHCESENCSVHILVII